MRKARFFMAEAVRSIRANMAVAVAATTTVAIAVFVLGAFIPSFLFVQSAVDQQKDRIDVRAYISDPATVEQVNELRDAIATMENEGTVESFEFVSKESALEIMRERL
ncbi:MAG: permease-like cell division protein FtsX, partial [Thermoleophilia bacterium]|nr:permease-like cell division protein FtsX [Thermoleophilia bacterium]